MLLEADAQPGGNRLPPGFSIIHANHLEDLRQVAVQWIARHPLMPLENEVFIVHSHGMAQWLKLALAQNEGCGISAAQSFQLPARFLWQAYRAVLGDEQVPPQSPYDKDRLTWRLLRLLPDLSGDAGFAPLARFLADDADHRKRYQLACHLADLYDQYQVYRADWLEDWERGVDRLRNARGGDVDMPPGQTWQPELWRRIQADVPGQQRHTARSSLHRRFLQAAQALTRPPAGVPRRIIVFGICSLPGQALEALHALSRFSQVLMFVHNPCRHYWADIIEDRELLRIERARHPRKARVPENLDAQLLHQHVNPLLAAWGKQGRDYIGLLYGYDQPDEYRRDFAEIDLFADFVPQGGQGTLLQQVQQAILNLQPLPAVDEDKQPVAAGDRSICFQLSHSRQREVEVLQDQLLFLFEQMPDLRPRDIIVMTPAIADYAPHIEAVFGNLPPQDARYIPFSIADRAERGSLPMLWALSKLLQLPDCRLTVSDLLDLLDVPAFRARFDLDEADLPRLHQWIEGAGIRWGLDAGHRADFDLPSGLEQNTWLFGLRRMLLGYAVGDGDAWEGIEPYDEIGGLEAALVGPLDRMLEQLEKHRQALGRPANPELWSQRILELVNDCLRPVSHEDQLSASRLDDVLDQWLGACNDAGLQEELPLAVVRDAILGAMDESSISQRFLAGMVNFCTLMPMRAIPFQVVCLLGMNDGQYPRSRPAPDFDLMAMPGCYRPGDRSRREDDRYLFLEALLSARELLYISYIGRSVRDNSERMPSVLVAQLRDYLAAGWNLAGAGAGAGRENNPLLAHLTCQHPLQPFSQSYFLPGRAPGLFSYSHEWRGILAPRTGVAIGADKLVPGQFEGGLQLARLIGFLKNPVKYFFNQRLKVRFDPIRPAASDQEPFCLDALAPFGLGKKLLEAGLAVDPAAGAEAVRKAAERLRRTGDLPINGLGELSAGRLAEPVQAMLAHHHELLRQWPLAAEALEIRLPVPIDGCDCDILEDWLDGLHRADPQAPASARLSGHARWEFYPNPVMGSNGRVRRPSSLIGMWVRHLAGCTQGMDLTSCLVAPDGVVCLRPLDQQDAGKWLADIIAHAWMGLAQPLPVTARTALAYLNDWRPDDPQNTKAEHAARKAYEGDGYYNAGELGYGDGVYLKRCYPDFDTLWQARDQLFLELVGKLYEPLAAALCEHSEQGR